MSHEINKKSMKAFSYFQKQWDIVHFCEKDKMLTFFWKWYERKQEKKKEKAKEYQEKYKKADIEAYRKKAKSYAKKYHQEKPEYF